MKYSSTVILSSAALLAASLGAMPQDVHKGYIAAPPGTETLTADVAPLSMQLFESKEFKGTEATVSGVDTTILPGALNEMPKGLSDSLTSLRWNLPAGVIVVFYEDGAGKGEQLIVWGKGQVPDISKWDFNDKASRWAWYDVGGGPGTKHSEAAKLAPNGSKALTTAVPENTMQMFKNHKFEGDLQQVSPVTATAAGAMNDVPSKLDDSLTSLRWNLPEGVVVLLYQDADGKKQQVGIWGKAQLDQLDLWDFNDKVSRWSWAYVGTR